MSASQPQTNGWRLGLRHLPTIVLLLLVFGPLVGIGYFNTQIYKTYGLEEFSAEEHEAAIFEAASLFAKTIGFEAVEVMDSEFCDLAPITPRGAMFSWGIVRLAGTGEKAGIEQRAFISLKRNPGSVWKRAGPNNSAHLIVDPDFELFFLPTTTPNLVKLKMEARRLWREQLRRFREVYGSNGPN